MQGMNERPKHILIVEDEEHLAHGIKFNLDDEGYLSTIATDGPCALKLLAEQADDVDLVILDLMLPGMSGYTICQAIRDAGNHVPVLILSARTLAEDRIRGYDVGANQYLQKPFDLAELLAMVRNLLGQRLREASRAPHTYEFGRAKVNFDTYEVTVDGREQQLTPIELNLLRYFVENEGRVISRGELLERVWRQPNIESTRTVDNFIVRLRKYFEVDPAEPRHFLSVRGAGYRFVRAGDADS